MSANESSQPQQAQSQGATNPWQRAITEQIAEWAGVVTQIEQLETKGFEQACANADEAARLAKESAAYVTLLGAQWRKLAVDATRQAFEMLGAKA